MTTANEWLRRADWKRRSPELGELVIASSGAAMILNERVVGMKLGDGVKVDDQLWKLWSKVSPHSRMLNVIWPGLVVYAAIDWRPWTMHVGLDANDDATLARCGVDIAQTLDWVLSDARDEGAWFACPFVKRDLQGDARIGFISPGKDSWSTNRLPPELGADWPRADQRAMVFAAAHGMRQLATSVDTQSELGAVITRASDPDPSRRFQTLAVMVDALERLCRPRSEQRIPRAAWRALEQGLGFYMAHDLGAAATRFDRALRDQPDLAIAGELCNLTSEYKVGKRETTSGEIHNAVAFAPPASLPIARPPMPQFPVPRVFTSARGDSVPSVIGTGTLGPVANDDDITTALRRRDFAGALALVDAQLAIADDARSHHLRGKALFALGRIADARAAFDRACTLKPALLEAMLLRREMDRAMKEAGTANRVILELPEHLAELRDILVAGRIVDAIQLLRRPAYDDDRTAQLLLAELLVTDDRLDDALVIFDRLDEPLGKARTLLSLDRPAEALIALTSDADDALELRAKILLALNRCDEAERAMDEYLRAVERRSDRRLESR